MLDQFERVTRQVGLKAAEDQLRRVATHSQPATLPATPPVRGVPLDKFLSGIPGRPPQLIEGYRNVPLRRDR